MKRHMELKEEELRYLPEGASITRGRDCYLLEGGNPAIVYNNVILFKQLPLMDESVGKEKNTTAYNAWIDDRDGRIFCFSNEIPGYIATFKCHIDFESPMRVLRIYTHRFRQGGSLLHKPLEEDTVMSEKAKRTLYETAYLMNRHLEEVFEKYLEKNRKGCLGWLWPFGRRLA